MSPPSALFELAEQVCGTSTRGVGDRHRHGGLGLLHVAGIAVAVDDARGLPSESAFVLLLRAQDQTGERSSPTLAKFSFVDEFCDNAD